MYTGLDRLSTPTHTTQNDRHHDRQKVYVHIYTPRIHMYSHIMHTSYTYAHTHNVMVYGL